MNRRVVITGMGVITPNANGLEEYEDALRNERSGIRFIEILKELNFKCHVGGVPQNFDERAEKYFGEEDMMTMNPTMKFASMAGIDAWRDAGFEVSERTKDEVFWDTGLILGAGLGGMDVICERVAPFVNKGKAGRMGSSVVEQTMNSSVSAKLSGFLGLGNKVTSNSSACNTGTEAVIDAYNYIKYGFSDKMLAGGAEGASHYMWGGFDAMRVLSNKFNDAPEKASRPMSATAGGFVPGSGSGVLFLEHLESAQERGVRIYAEIIGTGLNCGGQRMGGSMTAPNPVSVQRCIRAAVKEAGIKETDVDYINGHLTGTFADPHEVNNWAKALELPPEKLPPINATKSLVGHGLGASGAIESIAAIIQMNKGFIHKSLNCEDLHEKILPFKNSIPQETIEKEMNIVAKASFGFGDVNGCVIYKKWDNGK
jgi:3-oxoacyl-(acyl-carrier-protein) synthase